MDNKRRIKNLERKYSKTNVAQGEKLPKSRISEINKTYNENQKKRRVDGILNKVKNRDTIKEEVHQIAADIPTSYLCYNCKEELVIAAIILYVSKTRNKKYRIETTALWNEYNLDWRKYALIVERLLKWTRENKTYIKNDNVVDNEDFIRW